MRNRRPIQKSEALGALVGVAGLVAASVERAAASRRDGERAAKAKFLDWIRLGFDHPAFANPELAEQAHGKAIPDDRLLFEQYQWFVAYFLNTAEEIFRLTRGRRGWPAWESVLIDQVGFHAAYLKGPWKANGYDAHYSPAFRAFIEGVLETARVRAWAKKAGG